MIRACLLVLLAIVAGAEPAKSDLFRCVEADGSLSFVDRPELCAQANPHPLRGRVERVPAPAASTGSPVSTADGVDLSLELRLEHVLLPADEVGVAWDVVEEAPAYTERDPDLVRWGVRAQRARHYTRQSSGGVQVCSIEVWGFANVQLARRAHENFAYPGWQIVREGSLLLMSRGLTRTSGEPARRGVFAACQEIGERVRERAARLESD
jgi:hypothetical protein